MSRIITKKLMYIIVVLAVLAMMIPMAVPVSAAGSLSIYLLDPVSQTNPTAPSISGLAADSGFNITGSMIRVVPVGTADVTKWAITNYDQPMPGHADAQITASALGAPGVAYADILTGYGPLSIVATLSDNTTVSKDKKTTQIDHTTLTAPADVVVVWNEGEKSFSANATATDTVSGIFTSKDGALEPMPIQGVILHWYLVAGGASVQMGPGMFSDLNGVPGLNTVIAALPRATFTTFANDGTDVVTVTDANGQNTVDMTAIGEEHVQVVVVPEYPNLDNVQVTSEVTPINFWTSEMEKVPQVRWAGEKIVLEKYFGPAYAGHLVRFSLENQSPGALEGLQGTPLGNLNNTAQTVWDVVSTGTDAGWARCMLVSEDQGEVDVDLALYDSQSAGGPIVNQHGFVVFYMKLESITLGNVQGKRAGHNTGDWTPANPWDPNGTYTDPATPDLATETLNVSQDALLRARVKGWFMGDNMSTRKALDIDMDLTTPGVYMETLPAGRWVLPDDWAILAGPNWKAQRIHWDIMDRPQDNVQAINPLGDYQNPLPGPVVAYGPVIGPFRPGLEVPTSTGYNPAINTTMANSYDDALNTSGPWAGQKTVVPDGFLDVWDAPMPPAKITFQIQDKSVVSDETSVKSGLAIGDAGFFKDTMKTEIYYLGTGADKVYTAPFYQEMIPAFRFIPPFVNNGGYDWNSWNTVLYGPYQFWDIFNRPPNLALPTTTRSNVARDNANFPAEAQVYSDNHGEAMIYLNGNYNLNPLLFTPNGHDIPFGSPVASTKVSATADYPYFRKHNQLVSAPVTKTWTWGGMILGPSNSESRMILTIGDYTATSSTDGTSNKKMVWIWATDRDGLRNGVYGAGVPNTRVQWSITPGTDALIPNETIPGDGVHGVSTYQQTPGDTTMQWIGLEHGFLQGTNPTRIDNYNGVSWMHIPTPAEETIFNKFWGENGTNPIRGADGNYLDPANFVCAAIAVIDQPMKDDITVSAIISSPDFGTLAYLTNVNFASSYPLDDNILPGDANLDGKVNMADVTATERIILGLSGPCIQADSNETDQINMGDVVKTERIILGIK